MEKIEIGSPMWHLAEAANKAGSGLFTGEFDGKTYQFRLVWGPDYRHVRVQDQNGCYTDFEKSGEDWIALF